eukprot:COSAG04_NODE_211_length_20110_cov_36.740356_8_plen_256_part_00
MALEMHHSKLLVVPLRHAWHRRPASAAIGPSTARPPRRSPCAAWPSARPRTSRRPRCRTPQPHRECCGVRPRRRARWLRHSTLARALLSSYTPSKPPMAHIVSPVDATAWARRAVPRLGMRCGARRWRLVSPSGTATRPPQHEGPAQAAHAAEGEEEVVALSKFMCARHACGAPHAARVARNCQNLVACTGSHISSSAAATRWAENESQGRDQRETAFSRQRRRSLRSGQSWPRQRGVRRALQARRRAARLLLRM